MNSRRLMIGCLQFGAGKTWPADAEISPSIEELAQ
jgi:hypothetical protein